METRVEIDREVILPIPGFWCKVADGYWLDNFSLTLQNNRSWRNRLRLRP